MILPYSKLFKTLEETFAATNFTTKFTHEWPSAIGWLAHGLADVRLRSLNIHDARLHTQAALGGSGKCRAHCC